MNTVCIGDYSLQTKNSMAQLSEREIPLELVEVSELIILYECKF